MQGINQVSAAGFFLGTVVIKRRCEECGSIAEAKVDPKGGLAEKQEGIDYCPTCLDETHHDTIQDG
jgi:hypothetical protein